MHTFAQPTHLAGLDWAKDHHHVVILDRHGSVVEAFVFPHDAGGWEEFRQRIKVYPSVGVAIETSQGAAVAQWPRSGVTVYPVAPNQATFGNSEKRTPSKRAMIITIIWLLTK